MTTQVSGLKRPAEFQLTKEVDQILDEEIKQQDGNNISSLSEVREHDNVAEDSKEVIESRRIVSTKLNAVDSSSALESSGAGFLAYSKTNPFAAAFTSSSGFSGGTISSTSVGGGFGLSGFSSAPKTFGSSSSLPSGNQKVLKVSTKSNNDIPVASLTTPSPKTTEKINPFSSVSPKLNPFVKIAECREEPFLERSTSQSSQSSSNSTKPIYNAPVAKSFFTTFKDGKLSVNTSVKSSPASTSLPSTSTVDKVHDIPPIDITRGSPEQPSGNGVDQDPNNTERDEADADDDEEDREEEPKHLTFTKICHLPENVVVSTGEENEDCVLQLRAKLYRWISKSGHVAIDQNSDASKASSSNLSSTDGMWVEVGVGPARFLRDKQASVEIPNLKKTRIVMRREEKKGGHGTKLLLNVPLQGYVSFLRQGDKAVRIACVHPELEGKDPSPQMYILKVKMASEADEVFDFIETAVDEAKTANY